MSARETRTRIIQESIRLIREHGPTRFTLDEAARQANVSKGEILYHFPSKDELIKAMVQHLMNNHEARLVAAYKEEKEGPYRWLRAYLAVSCAPDYLGQDPAHAATLAALTLNPSLVEPVQKAVKRISDRIFSDGPNPNVAFLVSLSIDGLFLNQTTGLKPFYDNIHERPKEIVLNILAQPVHS